MLKYLLSSAEKLFFSSLSIAFLMLSSHGALAAGPVVGCDPKVLAAMQAQAKAHVDYDVAVVEQLTDKPDSVLALTCFNQAAGVSAKKGGEIFSGDFTSDLSPIVTTALTDSYKNFKGAPGYDSSKVDYTSTALTDTFNCPQMDNLWKLTQEEPTKTDVPYPDFSQLAGGTKPPGGGDDFNTGWDASQADFTNVKTTTDALPKPSVPDFSGADSSCEVMVAAGIIPGPCQ